MRYGVVSDIHANIQAWRAVLRDMKNQGVDVILCLGDVVGYGPNPAEVLESCYEHVDYFILGNHDAVIGDRLDSDLFNDNAKYLIEWTRNQLNPAACDFFSEMPLRMEGEGFICAHGELAMPGRFGYIYEAQDAIASFTSNESPIMFVGHTHFPAKFVMDINTNEVRKDLPGDSFLLPNERYLINAGSVGDPRDGNTAASYCIYDTDQGMVKFRQIPFDIEKFRSNLEKAHLPVNPFFLRVYDGQKGETETIKDMQVMETNQATEATSGTQRVIRVGEDVKRRRQKLNFSLDDVIQNTRHYKAQEATRREAEAKSKKKGKAIVLSLIGALVLIFLVIILVLRPGQEDQPTRDNDITNNAPDFIKDDLEVIHQVDKQDLLLSIDKAKLPEETSIDEESGLLIGWKKQTSKLNWAVQVKHKGWYEAFIEHAKSDDDSEVRIKMGFSNFDVALSKTAEGKLEEKSLGYFESSDSGRMKISLIALKPGSESVTALKSIRLKYHGDKKPNPFGELADEVFDDFSAPYFDNNWVIKGTAFPHRPLSKQTISPLIPVSGVNGEYCAGSINDQFENNESIRNAQGAMISKPFIIKHRYIHMLAVGGDGTLVEVFVKGYKPFSKKPPYSTPLKLQPFSFDLTDYLGKEARLIFRDIGNSNLVFDNIVFSNQEVADLIASSNQLRKPVPKIIERPGDANLSKAGKRFIIGDLEGTITNLLAAKKPAVTKAPNVSVDTSSLIPRVLNFQELKLSSKKPIVQAARNEVILKDCANQDVVILKAEIKEPLKIKHLQTDFLTRGAGRKKTVGMGTGNINLSHYSFHVARKEILNKGRYVRVSLENRVGVLCLTEVQVMSDGKNVALNKEAKQSSTILEGEASRAVDGNTNGDFDKGGVAHTGSNRGAWWMVDLGSEIKIDSIKIFNIVHENPKINQRLDRYTVSILDKNKNIIWQNFKAKAEVVNNHQVKNVFNISFSDAKATHTQHKTSPLHTIANLDKNLSWGLAGGERKNQKLWHTVKEPLVLLPGDMITLKLYFDTKFRKHVAGRMKFTLFATDDKKRKKVEDKFKSFFDLQSAVLKTFEDDIGKEITVIAKGAGQKIPIKVEEIRDGQIYIRLKGREKQVALNYDALSEQEKEIRIKSLENGELIWAFHKGELKDSIKDLSFNKESYIGRLIEASSQIHVARENPMVLTGRYIEIWHQKVEGQPRYVLHVNSAGEKLTKAGKKVDFETLYPDYPVKTKFDVYVFDMGVMRNIDSFKIVKREDGKISRFTTVIKDNEQNILWQKSWFLADLFEAGGMNFDLRGGNKQPKSENLAKNARLIQGEEYGLWRGLTDGIRGASFPFAFAAEGEPPQEIILDLGEEKAVNAFRAYKTTSSAFNGIQISYSKDNETYSDLGAVSTTNNSRETVFWSIKEQNIRYVKIKFINNHSNFKHSFLKDRCVLSEFEVLKL